MAFNRRDHYFLRAKREGYNSRAAYKLIEIEQRFSLFRKGDRVLDLGAAPGGWMQVVSPLIGEEGKVVGIDLLEMEPLKYENTAFIQGDIRDPEVIRRGLELLGGRPDVIISDMAPNLSGIRFADVINSLELAQVALEIVKGNLRRGGHFLFKLFPGPETKDFLKECSKLFGSFHQIKPKASRSSSSEIYILGKKFLHTKKKKR